MKRFGLLLIVVTSVGVLVAGTFLLSGPPSRVEAGPVEPQGELASGPLDGLVFVGLLGQSGKPGDIEDTLAFDNGLFVSTECQLRCNYPASPYYVRRLEDKLEFVSESRCPHKDASIVWHGTIEDGVLRGESIWTVKRWYWTVEKKFWFEGKVEDQG